MVALAPNIILATGSSSMGPLMQISGVVPVVFAIVPDPVGAGYVNSLARPGGNATGFSTFEYSIGGKWLDLLKQIAPGITRVAVLRDPTISGGLGQFGAIQSAASSFAVEVTAINLRDATEIERAIMAFATTSSGGLIVTASPLAVVHRDFIVTLATRHKLPAIYFMRAFVAEGGLISYGPDFVDQYRGQRSTLIGSSRARSQPTCPYKLRPNTSWRSISKPQKALRLTVPNTLIGRADEVIE
jgi:putative ABC transport system substrate-binding protein